MVVLQEEKNARGRCDCLHIIRRVLRACEMWAIVIVRIRKVSTKSPFEATSNVHHSSSLKVSLSIQNTFGIPRDKINSGADLEQNDNNVL